MLAHVISTTRCHVVNKTNDNVHFHYYYQKVFIHDCFYVVYNILFTRQNIRYHSHYINLSGAVIQSVPN